MANFSTIWKTEHIRNKILATIGLVAVYKLLATIPVPGSNATLIAAMQTQLHENNALSFFGALMGGGIEQYSIILMGLAPYINATIIIQLLGVVIPSLERLKKE